MWNLINAPETEIFGIAIALMVLLGVLEVISMLAGGISDWLDNLLPDSLTETAHAEVGLDAADAGVFVRFLSWLYVGRVPVLMLMVVFLAVYGLTGYLFQTTFAAVFGSYLNGWLAAVAVWFLSLPLVRLTAGGLYKIMPKDETTAVSQESLIGRIGTSGAGRSAGGQRGAGTGEGCVWSTALCDGGTGFRRSIETGRRGVAGVAGGKYV